MHGMLKGELCFIICYIQLNDFLFILVCLNHVHSTYIDAIFLNNAGSLVD